MCVNTVWNHCGVLLYLQQEKQLIVQYLQLCSNVLIVYWTGKYAEGLVFLWKKIKRKLVIAQSHCIHAGLVLSWTSPKKYPILISLHSTLFMPGAGLNAWIPTYIVGLLADLLSSSYHTHKPLLTICGLCLPSVCEAAKLNVKWIYRTYC